MGLKWSTKWSALSSKAWHPQVCGSVSTSLIESVWKCYRSSLSNCNNCSTKRRKVKEKLNAYSSEILLKLFLHSMYTLQWILHKQDVKHCLITSKPFSDPWLWWFQTTVWLPKFSSIHSDLQNLRIWRLKWWVHSNCALNNFRSKITMIKVCVR